MQGLTVKQPYAWAIATGRKPVENRTRLTNFRGDIAIHGGAAWYPGAETDQRVVRAWMGIAPGLQGVTAVDASWWAAGWYRRVLAVADLHGCHVPEPGCCDSEWADRDVGAHWLLRNVRRLDEPVPARGFLGLWPLPDAVERAVCEQLTAPAVPL